MNGQKKLSGTENAVRDGKCRPGRGRQKTGPERKERVCGLQKCRDAETIIFM